MHPPVNITSNTTFSADNSMNYTIRLTHGSAFWTTIFDSTGASWSSGPFHAGTNQDVGCLATLTGQDAVGGVMADSKSEGNGGIGIGALAGGVVGAFVAGLILAALAMMFLAKKKKRSHVSSLFLVLFSPFLPCSRLIPVHLSHISHAHLSLHPSNSSADNMLIIEPQRINRLAGRIPRYPSPPSSMEIGHPRIHRQTPISNPLHRTFPPSRRKRRPIPTTRLRPKFTPRTLGRPLVQQLGRRK
jgi:hypothetical protein